MLSGNDTLNLSVTELVEFCARTGDLLPSIEGPSAIEGIRGHQKIQRQRNASWQKEVPLNQQIPCLDILVNVQGRLDLLSHDIIGPIVEEIKTTRCDHSELPESKTSLHWAQAKVYAYLYCLEKELESDIDVRVTWLNLKYQQVVTERKIYSHRQLHEFTIALLKNYVHWHKTHRKLLESHVRSASQLSFPFENYRRGQHQLARRIYQQIKNNQSFIVEAPTGIGKTISVLFPALKSFGKGLVDQIVYLTFRNSVKILVEGTLSQLRKNGLTILSVSIQAREKTCPCLADEAAESCRNATGVCTRTIGFFDRLGPARMECLHKGTLSVDNMASIADKHHICPFELSLHMTKWAQIIICDANYFFDPITRLNSFDDGESRRVCLIDEMHHLPERGRTMYSAAISSLAIDAGTKPLAKRSVKLRKLTKQLCQQLRSLHKEENQHPQLTHVAANIDTLIEQLTDDMLQSATTVSDIQPETKQLLKSLYRFQRIYERLDDCHRCIVEHTEQATRLQLFCCDASQFLANHQTKLRSVIGFSATLQPLDYHRRLSGMTSATSATSVAAIFPKENQLTITCDFIDTRWKNREDSAVELINIIRQVFLIKPGKYLIFFPSYAYLEQIEHQARLSFPELPIVSQSKQSTAETQTMFLDHFFKREEPVLGFAILGGVFAEGIDFLGNTLTGSIIVTAGMPLPDTERQHMMAYFEERGMNSFEMTYQVPGMIRVSQAAGRVIRSESDRGVVVLIDPRINRPDFNRLMPQHWQIINCKSTHQVCHALETFWTNG